ncbi:MAG TPA: SpoVR family protein, partial [Steroidobacteraceae bacterium]|nr:SpoVR family protein [Steroidobacteraceae bacterium]
MSADWRDYVRRIEELAGRSGLSFHPVDFEAVPDSFMMEIAVYGLPVRMPHWSFGVRYIYQLIQRRMGHSRLFEVVFPGNPGHAYLASSNGLAENILVTAHVLGHADFSRNNLLFRRCQEQVSEHIVEHAANHARQIQQVIETQGAQRVETVLDAALALEQHIDIDQALRRERYPEYLEEPKALVDDGFRKRFAALDPAAAGTVEAKKRAPVPPHPERDLLWFVANYAPEMDSWERDIFLAVRDESFYFYPVFATQIMNEGWASYWHARLLREADFIPQETYVDAIKCHSDVVRPVATGEQVALAINPYHLGFTLWEEIVKKSGIEAARQIMREDDDFSF